MDVDEGAFCAPFMRNTCTENADRAQEYFIDSLRIKRDSGNSCTICHCTFCPAWPQHLTLLILCSHVQIMALAVRHQLKVSSKRNCSLNCLITLSFSIPSGKCSSLSGFISNCSRAKSNMLALNMVF